jgi:hypothetical protein
VRQFRNISLDGSQLYEDAIASSKVLQSLQAKYCSHVDIKLEALSNVAGARLKISECPARAAMLRIVQVLAISLNQHC